METKQKTHFDQFIEFKALSFKFDDSGKLLDLILDQEDCELPVRNVCAKIHESLIQRLDSTINTLQVSKREFIEYAIIQALDRADEIINEVDITEFSREQNEAKEVKS